MAGPAARPLAARRQGPAHSTPLLQPVPEETSPQKALPRLLRPSFPRGDRPQDGEARPAPPTPAFFAPQGPSWHRGPVQTPPRLNSFSPHPRSLLTRTKQGKKKLLLFLLRLAAPCLQPPSDSSPTTSGEGCSSCPHSMNCGAIPQKNISYRQQEEVARPPAPSLQSTASRGEVWEEKAAPGEDRRLESLQHRRRAVPTGRRRVWGRFSRGRWRRRPGRKSSW